MTFLREPDPSPEVQAKYDADLASYGFVMDLMRLWTHQPGAHTALFELIGSVGSAFTFRERGIMVTAAASTIGDSYCSFAWGWKLSEAEGADAVAGVLSGTDAELTGKEAALASWARSVAGSAGRTTEADVQALRDAGWTDEEVFRATAFVALRVAFSTVNAALGAQPDAELAERAPATVRDLITWGRPVGRPDRVRRQGQLTDDR